MCGGSPDAPAPPPTLPEAPRAPDVATSESATEADKRRRAAGGRSTILTGPRGVQNGAATETKTLLGQ